MSTCDTGLFFLKRAQSLPVAGSLAGATHANKTRLGSASSGTGIPIGTRTHWHWQAGTGCPTGAPRRTWRRACRAVQAPGPLAGPKSPFQSPIPPGPVPGRLGPGIAHCSLTWSVEAASCHRACTLQAKVQQRSSSVNRHGASGLLLLNWYCQWAPIQRTHNRHAH